MIEYWQSTQRHFWVNFNCTYDVQINILEHPRTSPNEISIVKPQLLQAQIAKATLRLPLGFGLPLARPIYGSMMYPCHSCKSRNWMKLIELACRMRAISIRIFATSNFWNHMYSFFTGTIMIPLEWSRQDWIDCALGFMGSSEAYSKILWRWLTTPNIAGPWHQRVREGCW